MSISSWTKWGSAAKYLHLNINTWLKVPAAQHNEHVPSHQLTSNTASSGTTQLPEWVYLSVRWFILVPTAWSYIKAP